MIHDPDYTLISPRLVPKAVLPARFKAVIDAAIAALTHDMSLFERLQGLDGVSKVYSL